MQNQNPDQMKARSQNGQNKTNGQNAQNKKKEQVRTRTTSPTSSDFEPWAGAPPRPNFSFQIFFIFLLTFCAILV